MGLLESVCSLTQFLFNKTDWSALGTFFGAGVALWIFSQWRGQKGSEVLATEAKSLIVDIFELNEIISKLVNGASSRDELNNLGVKYKVLTRTMKTKVNFILLGIDEQDKTKSIAALPDLMKEFYKSFSNALESEMTNDWNMEWRKLFILNCKMQSLEQDENSAYNKLKISLEDALLTCRDLSLYKK